MARWSDPEPAQESWAAALVQWAAFLILVALIVVGITAVEPM